MTVTIRDLYIGTGAYLGRVDSATKCAFWPTDPLGLPAQFDPAELAAVDLGMTAEAAAAGTIGWDKVETESGKMTFGPTWPPGKNVGRVYVREDHALKIPNPPVGSSGESYEFMLVIYRTNTGDPRAGLRYQGVKVEIIGPGLGGATDLWLYGPGQSKTNQRKRVQINFGG